MGRQPSIKTLSTDILNVLLSDTDFNHRKSVADISERLVALYRYNCGLNPAELPTNDKRLKEAGNQKKQQVQDMLDAMLEEQERRDVVRRELSGLTGQTPKDVVCSADAVSPILFSGVRINVATKASPSPEEDDAPDKKGTKYYWVENRSLDDFQIELLIDLVKGLTFLAGDTAVDNLVYSLRSMQSVSVREEKQRLGLLGDSRSFDSFIDVWKQLNEAIEKSRLISFKYRKPVAKEIKQESNGSMPSGATPDDRDTKVLCEVVPDENDESAQREYLSPYRLHYSDGHVYLVTSAPKNQWRLMDDATGLFVPKGKEEEYIKKTKANIARIDPLSLYRVEWIDDLQLIEASEEHPYEEMDEPVVDDFLRGSFKGYGSRERLQTVTLLCSQRALPYVYEHFSYFANSADNGKVKIIKEKNLTKDDRDWYQVSFKAHPDSVRNWVLGWPRDIVVTEPLSLAKTIMNAYERNAYKLFPNLVKGLSNKKPDDVAPEGCSPSDSAQ